MLTAGLVLLSLVRPDGNFAVQGAGQIGDPGLLTEGFSAGFLGAAGIAVAGALWAFFTIRQPRQPEPAPVEPTETPLGAPAVSSDDQSATQSSCRTEGTPRSCADRISRRREWCGR